LHWRIASTVSVQFRFDRVGPILRRERDRVVVDGPEVEHRAVASEVAGVGDRMRALPAPGRQRHHERVQAERAVNVEVAEEDLLGLRHADPFRRRPLLRSARGDDRRVDRRRPGLAGPPVVAQRTGTEPPEAENGE
jgi:hypothetical protein